MFPEKRKLFSSVQADGVVDCKNLLNDLLAGEVKASFIEGMGCKGGCVGGPKAIVSAEQGKVYVDRVASESAIKMPFHSETVKDILQVLGIHSLEELRDDHSIFERKF